MFLKLLLQLLLRQQGVNRSTHCGWRRGHPSVLHRQVPDAEHLPEHADEYKGQRRVL